MRLYIEGARQMFAGWVTLQLGFGFEVFLVKYRGEVYFGLSKSRMLGKQLNPSLWQWSLALVVSPKIHLRWARRMTLVGVC